MPPPSLSPADWTDVYLVTRLLDTNLHRVIYSGHTLTDAHVQYILWQLFRALRYLHTAGVGKVPRAATVAPPTC
jgi:serine/threonine protein kinase